MKLSKHFTLAEYTASQTAARRGIDNTPREAYLIDNLKRMASVMEGVREILGRHPIHVSSGYRCLELNRALGSKDTSAHVQGLATDFICPGYGVPYDVCRAIEPHVLKLDIDQLIYEHTWVHIGLRSGPGRNQIMTLRPGGGYVSGIVLKGGIT